MSSASARLERELIERFATSLLPSEAMDEAQVEEAARFSLRALRQRLEGAPAIVIDSVGGRGAERHLRLAIVNDDMPFLVDSVTATVSAAGLTIDRLLHPVIAVRRDPDGRLTGLPDNAGRASGRESVIYLETERADARLRRRLAGELATTLGDVHAAVADWDEMRRIIANDADRLGDSEGAALLRWLESGMLTQLGHVTRRRDGSQGEPLGVCRASARDLLSPASYQQAFGWFEGQGPQAACAPLIVKANLKARVHRPVPLDLFIVPVIEAGEIAALSVHAGVWTSAALATPPDRIPRMRSQLNALMARLAFDPRGHAGKALVHALTALPHDLLIGFTEPDLERIATTMMSLVDRPRPKLALVRAPLDRHRFAFVWIPRDQLSAALRLQVEDMLTAAVGPVLDWSIHVEASSLALLRFVLDIRAAPDRGEEAALDLALRERVRGWADAVEAELAQGIEGRRAAAIAARYAEAFPEVYRSQHGAAEAARDIHALRGLGGAGSDSAGPERAVRLREAPPGSEERTRGGLRLKLYQRSGNLALSDAVPVLESFGFKVIAEHPTLLDGGRLGSIHDFLVSPPAGAGAEAILARAQPIEAALAAVLNEAAEDDAFNRLVVAMGLEVREAEWLRAWFRYMRQTGLSFTLATVVDALQRAPEVTRGILALFVARHDPRFHGSRGDAEAEAEDAVRRGLAGVAAINDDRLLRRYHGLVAAILRTNAFVAGAEALAFKLDPAAVPGLPRPLPWREIFVYARRVEGAHLRAGPIARGGLRWSDRRDDFRTEVLGLMKAQRVKNAVIVPTGAKGGFYPKQLPDPAADREAWLAEGKASYAVFVRTLLSVSDNLVGGKVVHPDGVVVRDGDDPYFVVAADKGTATFSDLANAVAAERNFWLDDAFASGGSKGYDHKAMGITARGAWISVRRHFMEVGVDVQADPVSVAGVGDMSGDVFGNGMLLSQAIRLVAAFDHRHVFLDPDPDPETSWAERKRLFDLPRSSWTDYNAALISQGGGVYARSEKAIALSPQVRDLLDIEGDSIDPDGLIRAILRARVDLLWFGGIGTYVKAAAENHVAVGDPANDALRVDGAELRAKVIGEGANLGVTQAGRIEFAERGGRINTDFIDNSAGVDCSDNEVNIKIALASARRAGRLGEPARVALLERMTDEVAAIVLEDNRLQALALSIAERGGAAATLPHLRLIEQLEGAGQLDRRGEGLRDAETLARRAAEGAGISRPELAVLLSSAKLVLQQAIEDSALPDDPGLADELLNSFPAPMRRRYREEILGHRLRREIVATEIANRLVNRLGMIHPFELSEEEGTTPAHVATAFVAAEQLFAMADTWSALDEAAMPEHARLLLFERAAAGLRTQMADLIRVSHGRERPSELVAELGATVARLEAQTARLLNPEGRAHSARMTAELTSAGAPPAEAAAVVRLFDLDGAIGLACLARDRDSDVVALTHAFTDLGARLGLDWAQMTAARMSPLDPWERLLVAGLARDFQQMRLAFLRRARNAPGEFVARWAEAQAGPVRQLRALVARAQVAAPVTPAMLAQIAGQARSLLAR